MQFSNIVLALMASASMVMAVPANNANNVARAALKCPSKWPYCGTCNGSSCKIALTNHPCIAGTKCTKDGEICGSSEAIGDQNCPHPA